MFTTRHFLGSLISNGMFVFSKNVTQPIIARTFHFMSLTPKISSLRVLLNKLPDPMEVTTSNLLKPVNPILSQVAGFKVKGHLKRRCKDCYFVTRQQRLYVICKTHPRHKQMSMKARDYKSWILTHATQSKIRPY